MSTEIVFGRLLTPTLESGTFVRPFHRPNRTFDGL